MNVGGVFTYEMCFNIATWRKSGLAMATYGLKEMGKFLWEGREYGGERNEH